MEQPTPFHFYRAIPTPGAAGGKACTPYNLPAGTHDRIDHVTATTYNDAGAVVYIRYLAKIGNSVSQVLTLRVLTNANGDDPYPNTRSGILEWGAHVAGGDVFSVQFGEVHTLEACIQSSPGASASGSITLDGVEE
jgi:hypothetical protein